jgi:hypothetical protein
MRHFRRFAVSALLGTVLIGNSAAGQSLRGVPWRRAFVDSLDQTTLRAVYTAPVYDPTSWGDVLYWADTLESTALVFVVGTTSSGTGASQRAFFVYQVDSRWPPQLLWTALAEEEVSGIGGRIQDYHVRACLLVGADSTLHYLYEPPAGNRTARLGIGGVPHRSGVYRLVYDPRAARSRFVWRGPVAAATRRVCPAQPRDSS